MSVMSSFFLKGNRVKNCFILLVLCGVILLNKIFFSFSFLYPGRTFDEVQRPPYATPYYLELSKNAYEGIGPLIIGTEGNRKIYTMGDYDPAFPILISILGFFGIEFHGLSDFKVINSTLLWLGLLCFSLIFIRKKPLIFLTTQILILIYFFTIGGRHSSFYIDYHSTVPALTILTFLLVEIFFNNKTKWQYLKLFTLSILGAVFGMFRNYFTYIFVFLIGLFSKEILRLKTKKTYSCLLFLYFAILILLNFSNVVQKGFYSYTRFKNPDLSLSSDLQPPYNHRIWHNAYIGLGYFSKSSSSGEALGEWGSPDF